MDGQTVFDGCAETHDGSWKIVLTLPQLMAQGKVPPMIVVGVDPMGASP
jgi:hypothetical protein